MNSNLYNNNYPVPENIISFLVLKLKEFNNINTDGKKKAKHLIDNKVITYQNLKRYKNYFENNQNENDPEYQLNGGKLMKNFVENTLKREREKVYNSLKNKTDLGGLNDLFKKETEQNNLKINTNSNFIKEGILTIGELEKIAKKYKDKTKKVSLSVIINNNKQILLVKRSNTTNWYPNHWALVGGKIEKNESPEEAMVREVNEETGLNIKKFKFKKIIKTDNVIEYLYLSLSDENEIKLNGEHSKYKWYNYDEIKHLKNTVPNLYNYIKLIIKK